MVRFGCFYILASINSFRLRKNIRTKSMQLPAKLILLLLLFIPPKLKGQDSETDRLIRSELKMTFPSIYFKHNSTDYAPMPYTVDSCFKYIALHFEDNINSLVIWRDSTETEELTNKRIEILKAGLKKYIRPGKIEIHSMGNKQKISRQTINMTSDSTKIEYLLSLNSVLDISKTGFPPEKKNKKKKRRRLVWTGWRNGFHWSTPG